MARERKTAAKAAAAAEAEVGRAKEQLQQLHAQQVELMSALRAAAGELSRAQGREESLVASEAEVRAELAKARARPDARAAARRRLVVESDDDFGHVESAEEEEEGEPLGPAAVSGVEEAVADVVEETQRRSSLLDGSVPF